MTEPKYKPILFTAPMVRAILEGRKSQTRRIVKVQPPTEGYTLSTLIDTTGPRRNIGKHHWLKNDGFKVIDGSQPYFSVPYAIGDRLWVKETYCYHDDLARCLYKADGINSLKWNQSIHMPRWASRITLEITGVRVERLQDISEDDAVAEGIEIVGAKYNLNPYKNYMIGRTGEMDMHCSCASRSYQTLFDSIHGPGSWEKNPWVWVVEFKRVEG